MTRSKNEDALFCDGGSPNCHNTLEVPGLPLSAARAWANKEKDWATVDGNDYCPECSASVLGPRRGDQPGGGTMPSPFPKVPEDLMEEEGAD